MKHAIKAMVTAGALGIGSLLVAAPADAHERRSSSVSVRVDLGNVSVGYRNGYYDHDRRWHRWRSHDHRNYYRRHYRSRYHDSYYRHDRRGRRHRDWDD
ncbi:MAG: hypothetical protein ACT4OF_08990 [Caulobacteraceae bacterium]